MTKDDVIKRKAPNLKLQAPEKSQAPIPKAASYGVGALMFEVSLVLGA